MNRWLKDLDEWIRMFKLAVDPSNFSIWGKGGYAWADEIEYRSIRVEESGSNGEGEATVWHNSAPPFNSRRPVTEAKWRNTKERTVTAIIGRVVSRGKRDIKGIKERERGSETVMARVNNESIVDGAHVREKWSRKIASPLFTIAEFFSFEKFWRPISWTKQRDNDIACNKRTTKESCF